jgi:hypothetical protein
VSDVETAIGFRNGLLEAMGLLDQLTPTEQHQTVAKERLEAILASRKKDDE